MSSLKAMSIYFPDVYQSAQIIGEQKREKKKTRNNRKDERKFEVEG
jgi:accessory gene regulator protein AgrB